MNTRKQRFLIVGIIALVAGLAPVVFAGDLNPPAAPNDAGSAMFSIEDLYLRLLNGTAGAQRGGTPGTFKEPAAAPVCTMHSLNDVMGVAPVKDTADGASADQVLAGKKFWGLKDGAGWGLLGGTMPMAAITAASTAVKGGYIATTTLDAIDADLVSANIKKDTTIFGVSGDANVVNTSTGNATAGEILLGRTAWVAGAEVTGTRVGGRVVDPAWTSSPMGIWRKNGNDVLDTRTGLIWHSQGSFFNSKNSYQDTVVEHAFTPWRLPTIEEYRTLREGPETAAASGFFAAITNAGHWSTEGVPPIAIKCFNPSTGAVSSADPTTSGLPVWKVR